MILYFSGTGNTRYCVERLARILGDEAVDICVVKSGEAYGGRDDIVVWAFPIYSWGVPPVYRKFMLESAPVYRDARHYMLATCGDDMGMADRVWRRLLRSRGMRAAAAYSVIMPNTYTLMKGFDVDPDDVARDKVERAAAAVDEIGRRICADVPGDLLHRGSFAWLKTAVIYPWFVRFSMSPKPFHATDACTGCATCARRCPLTNISMQSSRPVWGDDCALCLRCYHVCPHHAVAYGKATRGKGRWRGLIDNT